MTDAIFTDDDIQKAEECQTLGPAYFAAVRIVGAALQDMPNDIWAPIVKTAVDGIYEKVQEAFENSLWSDAEHNLQLRFYRGIDEAIEALIVGRPWALERYGLTGGRYSSAGLQIREAIARHVPKEIMDARIEDLEAEVARLKETIEFLRR